MTQMSDRVLGQNRNAIGIDQLRKTMIDLRIYVIRTTGKDNTHPVVFLTEPDCLFTLLLQIFLYSLIFCKACIQSLFDLFLLNIIVL